MDELTDLEKIVVEVAAAGSLIELRESEQSVRAPGSEARAQAARTVRAEVLIRLLTGQLVPEAGPVAAVKLRGACITGRLDLEALNLVCPLLLVDCRFEQPVILKETRASAIRLPGCHTPGVDADQLQTDGDLDLSGLIAPRGVRVRGARIGGRFLITDAKLSNKHGPALSGEAVTVQQGVFGERGFVAEGEVRLPGAQIGAQFNLSGACIANPDGVALCLDQANLEMDLFCQGLTAHGEVRLSGTHVHGTLDFSGASLTNPGQTALQADALAVDSLVRFDDGFLADGQIRLVAARIGGQLIFVRAKIGNGQDAEERIPRSMGQDTALVADNIVVEHGMICDGLTAHGGIRLVGAHVKGELRLAGTSLINENGIALAGQSLTVDRDMFCSQGFTARGEVRLTGAQVGELLDFTKSSLANVGGMALDLESVTAARLFLLPTHTPLGLVDLTNAHVGRYYDDPIRATGQSTWLCLNGFTYGALGDDTLGDAQINARDRLRWLRCNQEGYRPQLYEQLASVYRKSGRDEAARQVMIAKQWRRRRQLNPMGKVWSWLLYLTVGYGYRAWLAGLWLAAFTGLGAWIFNGAYHERLFQAVSPAPAFNPLVFTLDVLLPIVDLGQQRAWIPQGAALYWSWGLIGVGWILSTAVVAGLTKVLKRE